LNYFWGKGQLFVVTFIVLIVVTIAVFSLVHSYIDPAQDRGARKDVIDMTTRIIAGLSVLAGTYFAWQQIDVSREGQYTDRFIRAIDQIGSEKLEIRLGGIYSLERIAIDSPKDRWTVLETLAAFVRENSPLPNQGKEGRSLATDFLTSTKTSAFDSTKQFSTVTTDIQAALSSINRLTRHIENGFELDLSMTNLGGANLYKANLEGANLKGANLRKANLKEANLRRANMWGCKLFGVDLQFANLTNSRLDFADLTNAHLSFSRLDYAHLSRANLSHASIHGVNFFGAHLDGANIDDIQFDSQINLKGCYGTPINIPERLKSSSRKSSHNSDNLHTENP
jgi:uncharacterized protein YjbI with pentapeptide repeats